LQPRRGREGGEFAEGKVRSERKTVICRIINFQFRDGRGDRTHRGEDGKKGGKGETDELHSLPSMPEIFMGAGMGVKTGDLPCGNEKERRWEIFSKSRKRKKKSIEKKTTSTRSMPKRDKSSIWGANRSLIEVAGKSRAARRKRIKRKSGEGGAAVSSDGAEIITTGARGKKEGTGTRCDPFWKQKKKIAENHSTRTGEERAATKARVQEGQDVYSCSFCWVSGI